MLPRIPPQPPTDSQWQARMAAAKHGPPAHGHGGGFRGREFSHRLHAWEVILIAISFGPVLFWTLFIYAILIYRHCQGY